jgi:hypothetical protein
MPRTIVTPSMKKVASLDKEAKANTQSVAAAPQPIRAPNSPETFKAQPEIQTFRFKKNSRGVGGERE